MDSLNARAFLKKLVTHVRHVRGRSVWIIKNVEWAMGSPGLSSEDSRNTAFDYVSPVCFIECMCAIAIFELGRHFELNRVMQSDTKLLYGP